MNYWSKNPKDQNSSRTLHSYSNPLNSSMPMTMRSLMKRLHKNKHLLKLRIKGVSPAISKPANTWRPSQHPKSKEAIRVKLSMMEIWDKSLKSFPESPKVLSLKSLNIKPRKLCLLNQVMLKQFSTTMQEVTDTPLMVLNSADFNWVQSHVQEGKVTNLSVMTSRRLLCLKWSKLLVLLRWRRSDS